jgi:hypothetical protein
MTTRPIANKYCEGKLKSTLKRELKVVKPVGWKRMEPILAVVFTLQPTPRAVETSARIYMARYL